MTDFIPQWIQLAANAPDSDDLSFIFLATFVTVALLAWLSGTNHPQRPKRPLILRNWQRVR